MFIDKFILIFQATAILEKLTLLGIKKEKKW
jgi:hypothetical protein